MSCPGCDNSSTTYTRCNPPVSTNCVFYQGDTKTCQSDTTFTVCKGENMSDLQEKIFDKICQLSGKIDVTSIVFPCSLKDAWLTEEKTILNLLEYMVTIQCNQQTSINTINSQLPTLNPIVSVCFSPCCDNSTCGTTELHLNQALEKIIECICGLRTRVEAAETSAKFSSDQVASLSAIINNPNTGLLALQEDYAKFKANALCRIANLETLTQSLAPCVSCTTCPTYP